MAVLPTDSSDVPRSGAISRGAGNLGKPSDPYTGTLVPNTFEPGVLSQLNAEQAQKDAGLGGGSVASQLADANLSGNRYQDWVAYNQAKDAASDPFEKLALALNLAGVGAAAGGAAGLFGGAAGGGAGAGAGAAGAGTVASSAAGDIALTDATAGLAADAGGLAASDAAAAGLGGVGAGSAAAGVAGDTLPELTVTAPSTAGAGLTAGDVAGAGAISASSGMLPEQTVTAQSTAGDGSSLLTDSGPLMASIGAVPGAMTDIGQTLNAGQPQFLSADDTAPSLQPMSGDLASQLGIDPSSFTSSLGDDTSGITSNFDLSNASVNPADTGINPATGAPDAGFSGGSSSSGGVENWLKNPRNLASLGSMGISALQSFSKPKLPAASQTAANNATAISKGALPIIQSGGTASPQWATQKASIDAQIDQQIKQQAAAIQQAAANSGMGDQNSGVVQQQIAQMTSNANTQRQQLYAQAQQQNVSNAIAELSAGDSTLAAIGNMQLKESEAAQAQAAQTAQLALKLYGMTGSGVPGP